MTVGASEPATPDEPCRAGLSLSRHAAVVAAEADDVPLERALAALGVDASAYPAAKAAWTVALTSDTALLALYQARLFAAEDRLTRAVAPLDAELPAWMGFLAAYGAHASPGELLVERKLRLPDLSRLSRRWARRLEAEPALRDEARRLHERGGAPARIPPLTLGESDLAALAGGARSEAEVVAAPVAAAPAPVSAADELTLDRYAAILAELDAYPTNERAVLTSFGLDAGELAAARTRYDAALAADAAVARDFRTLFTLAALRVERRGGPLVAEPRAAAPEHTGASTPVALEARATMAAPPPTHRATELALPRVPASALPFAEGRERASAAGSMTVPPPGDTTTGEPLPFSALAPATPGGRRSRVTARPGPRSRPRPRVDSGTGEVPAVGRERPPALPFPVEERAPRAPKNRKTEPIVLVAVRPTLPFRVAAPPPPVEAEPALSLEQHASLSVELALPRADVPAVLARYRLDAAGKEALDAHFRRAFEAEPALRARWSAACRSYYDWVTRGSRR